MGRRPLNVVFVVQGEGRGHMTQALALGGFLRDAGHRVTRVLLGTSPFRSVPEYFARQIDAPVETFDAPTQVPDRSGRAASAGATLADVAKRSPAFLGSARRIRDATAGADVVVNFLDLMGGLARVLPGSRSLPPTVAVAHNYLFLDERLGSLPGPSLTRRLVMTYVRATAAGAATRLALSFGPLGGHDRHGLSVTPPLLRAGLDRLQVTDQGHLLAYALNPGYGALLADWHRRHRDVPVHCYLDGGAAALDRDPQDGFHVHPLSEEGFLRHLASCRAYVGSAGFESICEAFYLGKPTLAVPTQGHYEQVLNAWDAARVGAARPGSYADLDAFWSDLPVPLAADVRDFRAWVAHAPQNVVALVERAAST
jgi:hypothetical protein